MYKYIFYGVNTATKSVQDNENIQSLRQSVT